MYVGTSLRGCRLNKLKLFFWPQAKFFGQEATLDFKHTSGEEGVGAGGVCMWIALRIAQHITETSCTQCRRVQWVRLGGLPSSDLSIFNVYASNSVGEGCALWEYLITILSKNCRWLVGRDWNFVEN